MEPEWDSTTPATLDRDLTVSDKDDTEYYAAMLEKLMLIHRRCLTDTLAFFQLVNHRLHFHRTRQKISWCPMSTDDSKLSMLMIAKDNHRKTTTSFAKERMRLKDFVGWVITEL